MHDSKAMPLAILMTNAFGRPNVDGINEVGWALDVFRHLMLSSNVRTPCADNAKNKQMCISCLIKSDG